MADEDTGGEQNSNPAQDRIVQLSGEVKTQATRADAATAEAAEATKRASFAEGFVDMVSTYPVAKEFKTDIQAKVMSGYTVEDATLAVLGKAGKLGGGVAPIVQEPVNPAGGSASTVVPQSSGTKSISEMTTAEKREALSEVSPQELFTPFRTN